MSPASPAQNRILLNEFNHRLRTLIRHVGLNDISTATDEQRDVETMLRTIYRRTFLAEWIADRYIIAIAGVQGAGKTTLLQQIYDLPPDGFLSPNAGRGERIPVLVTESDVKAPKGLAWRMQGSTQGFGLKVEDGLSVADFQQLAIGQDESVLMLELQVPFRHFKRHNTGFMLLPGFESTSRGNEGWQALLRDALALSTTCAFVTDPTLWASGENMDEAKEAFHATFNEVEPILVVTRADMRSPEKEPALRLRMAEALGIRDTSRVVSAGVESGDGKAWVGEFLKAIERYQAAPRGFRTAQIKLFRSILKRDLNEAIQACKSLIDSISTQRDDESYRIHEILEKYDTSSRGFKDAVARQLHENLQAHAKAQSDKLRGAILERKFWDKTTRFLFSEPLKDVLKAEKDLEKAWVGEGGHSTRACLAHALTEVAQKRLFLFPGAALPALNSGDYSRPLETLGYKESTNLPVLSARDASFLEPAYNLSDQVRTLMNSSEPGKDPDHGHIFDEAAIVPAVQALPLLAGELMRLAAFEPAWFEIKIEGADGRAIEATVDGFKELHGHKKELLSSMGSMLGIQGACDSIPSLVKGFGRMVPRGAVAIGGPAAIEGALTGTGVVGGTIAGEAAVESAAAGTAMATIASVAAAIGVTGAVTIAVMRVHFGREKDEAARIEGCLGALVDHQMNDYLSRLEELLSLFRERLENALMARYHLNKALGRTVNLEIALADMKDTRSHMLEQLDDVAESLGLNP